MPADKSAPAPQPNKWNRIVGIVTTVVLVLVAALYGWSAIYNASNLPDCDSKRARDTLSDVFKANRVNASRYNEIKTLANTKEEVRCTASLAVSEGGTVSVDYRFYWEDSKAKIEYRISR